MKKVPERKITAPQEAAGLAGLPFEATVTMTDIAGAMREGLLPFSTVAGLVVMHHLVVRPWLSS